MPVRENDEVTFEELYVAMLELLQNDLDDCIKCCFKKLQFLTKKEISSTIILKAIAMQIKLRDNALDELTILHQMKTYILNNSATSSYGLIEFVSFIEESVSIPEHVEEHLIEYIKKQTISINAESPLL